MAASVETLGWNFRNNWELAVDSFGTIWQSDNDDDGNKGVRINYVMEYGNYGYKDEMTGAAWKTPRENLEKEIPQQHWHLNDPGVVPTLLLTGAGSPTGICVYEGTLLPEVFRNQVIHCDAGPSIVRAYVTKKDGAGYKAEIVNILDGSRATTGSGRAMCASRPTARCSSPIGTIRASAATISRMSIAGASFALPRRARNTACRSRLRHGRRLSEGAGKPQSGGSLPGLHHARCNGQEGRSARSNRI